MIDDIEHREKCIAPGETSEVPTKRRRGDRIVRNGQLLEFIEEELEGEKWIVLGPAPDGIKMYGINEGASHVVDRIAANVIARENYLDALKFGDRSLFPIDDGDELNSPQPSGSKSRAR